MKKTLLSAIIGASFLALPALAQNVAIVNGKPVPTSRMDELAAQVTKSGRQVTPEMKPQLKEEVIAREVFLQEAQKRGLEKTADFKAQLEFARQTMLIRELFVDYQKANPVSDADLKAEYDRQIAEAKAQVGDGKEYHAHHILVDNEDEAKKLIAQIKKGGKFDELAKKNSKDTGSGAKGGDLDWVAPSGLVKEFSEAMVKLNKGQMTDSPVKTQFGYHIIRLDEVRQGKPQEFPAFDQIKDKFAQQMSQAKLTKYQEELRAKAKIE